MNEPSEVKLHFLDYWRVIKLRLGLILLVFFLVMVTAGVTIKFLPREYLSTVTMEVKQDNSSPMKFGGELGPRSYDPQFVTTQFQILRKTEILYPVIEQLKLIDEFSAPGSRMSLQQVFSKLRNSLNLTEVRNTSLIDIGVYDTDAQRAANIANTIAVVYKEKRREDLQKAMDSGLDQLQDQVDKQRKLVEQESGEAMKIRAREGIIDPDPDKENSAIGKTEGKLQFDTQQHNEQQLRVTEMERQLELIQNLAPEYLMNILPTLNIQDPTISKTLPLFQDTLATEAWLTSSGVGENHPRMKSLRAQKKTYSAILSDQLESIKRAQANRLLLEKDKLKALDARLEESRLAEIAEKTKIAEYIDAKNKYIQARRIQEQLETNLSTERVKRQIETDMGKIWQKAEKSDYPDKPHALFFMLLAAGMGLLAGVLLAFFIEYLDTSVKTIDDVERYLQSPVLAIIPKNVSILMNTRGDTPDAEAYRILRTNIEFNKPQRDANTFTLISGGPGEGKSTTLNNLAYTCAKGGYNVLVVDADLRRATQHQLFNVDNKVGLTDYLLGRAELDEIVKTTKIDNLSFISSGELPSDALGILNSQRMTELIAKVKQQYDLVFFDAPPILGVSDGSVIVSEVDVTIMVVQHRRFPRSMLQRVKQSVANVGGRLIGVVLNNFDAKHDDGYAYYNNYYDYYAPRDPKRIEPTPPKLPRPRPAVREDY
jgi:succinoglycan biosynthesis transport protein ExoP